MTSPGGIWQKAIVGSVTRFWMTVSFLVVVGSYPSEGTTRVPSHLIVPGKSVGWMNLNDDSTRVTKILGPLRAGDAMPGKRFLSWENVDVKFVKTGGGSRYDVSSIRVRTDFYPTSSGIRCGSTFAEVNES